MGRRPGSNSRFSGNFPQNGRQTRVWPQDLGVETRPSCDQLSSPQPHACLPPRQPIRLLHRRRPRFRRRRIAGRRCRQHGARGLHEHGAKRGRDRPRHPLDAKARGAQGPPRRASHTAPRPRGRHAVTRADLVDILDKWDHRLAHYRRAYSPASRYRGAALHPLV